MSTRNNKIRVKPIKQEEDDTPTMPHPITDEPDVESTHESHETEEEKEEEEEEPCSNMVSWNMFHRRSRRPVTKRPRLDDIDISPSAIRALTFAKWESHANTMRSKCTIERMLKTIQTCAHSILSSTGEDDNMFTWDIQGLSEAGRRKYFDALQDQIQRMAEIMNAEVVKCSHELRFIDDTTALSEWT